MKFRTRVTRAQPIAWPRDRGLSANPNKGATRSKIIGLTADWSQPIRVEKWLYPNRIRPVYFMVCPGHEQTEIHRRGRKDRRDDTCVKPHRNTNGWDEQSSIVNRKSSIPNSSSALSAISAVNPPPLSTRRPGRLDPSKSGGACPQRCLKLLMVQCTKAEARDADLAQLWLDSIPPRLRHHLLLQPFINRLLTRYGLIMFPRVLLCPRCLKVRYGNNPETVRQGWRRRNKRPDTSVRGNAQLLGPGGAELTPLNHFSRTEYNFAQMRMNEGRTRKRKTDSSQAR